MNLASLWVPVSPVEADYSHRGCRRVGGWTVFLQDTPVMWPLFCSRP